MDAQGMGGGATRDPDFRERRTGHLRRMGVRRFGPDGVLQAGRA